MSELGNWRELTEGVFVAVAEPATVNVGLIVGSKQALIVDTGSSPAQGRQLRAAVSQVTDRPLRGVVVTHWHYDHAFGMAAFSDLETIGHESVAARLNHQDAERQAQRLGLSTADLALPGRAIAVATALDLGSRRVEIAHLGLGHTDGDLVVVVPEADLLFVGDLVESGGPPWYGNDSYPDEWPATLDGVIGLMGARSQAVPGHGDPVNRMFVFQQRSEIAAVAGEIRRLAESGVAESEAVERGSWPFPEINISAGVTRGYQARRTLPGQVRRANLPLV